MYAAGFHKCLCLFIICSWHFLDVLTALEMSTPPRFGRQYSRVASSMSYLAFLTCQEGQEHQRLCSGTLWELRQSVFSSLPEPGREEASTDLQTSAPATLGFSLPAGPVRHDLHSNPRQTPRQVSHLLAPLTASSITQPGVNPGSVAP